MKVVAIMATCGRHKLCERSLRFFLDQDYTGWHVLLIYNNSPVPQELQIAPGPPADVWSKGNKLIKLINQHIDSQTDQPYTNLGAIYNDAIKQIPDGEADVIIHWDDDDIFMPNHISAGVEGLTLAEMVGKVAYKPERSYFRHPTGIQLMGNNLEPSVFVRADHIFKYGYSLTTSDQHMPWFNSLLSEGKMAVDSRGLPTLIYNWGDVEIPTFKTSGNAGNPHNFENYRNFSQDHGDQKLTPWSEEKVQNYYNLIQ